MLPNLRYSLHTIARNPAFALVAVLSLALGIGANTAIFQLLDSVRMRTLPVARPDELVELRLSDLSVKRGSTNRENSVTYPIWEEIRKRQQAFSGIFAWSTTEFNLSPAGEVRMVNGLWVSGEFFQTLGVKPALGRLLGPGDDQRGCGAAGAVISHAFWQSQFDGDPGALGRKLSINSRLVEVIGVAPYEFFGLEVGRNFSVALPFCAQPAIQGFSFLDVGTIWWMTVMGRLKPGWTIERASAHAGAISPAVFESSLPAGYPRVSVSDYLNMRLAALPAGTGLSGLREQYADPLVLLLAIAALVLLTACANLANLMLARASARSREIAIRLAIGASRGHILRQLMGESGVLASSGALAGLLLSRWLTRILVSLLNPVGSTVALDLAPDWRVLAFTAALAALTCAIFGVTPAVRATGAAPGDALKSGGRGLTASHERFGLRRALVVSQVALSLVLLVGALLFAGSLSRLASSDAGLKADGILVADLGFPRAHPSEVQVQVWQQSLLDHLRAIPGVASAADTSVVPLSGNAWGNKTWMETSDPSSGREVLHSTVSDGYFRTLGIPLVAGRDFDRHDKPGTPAVAIVNQSFARQFTGGQNPVGRRFRVEATPTVPETAYEIVGMVGDAKYRSVRHGFAPVFYLPYSQDPHPINDQLLIRSGMPLESLAPSVRRALAEVDPDARYELYELKDVVVNAMIRERLMATLSGAFGVLAGLLSAIGVYGVIAYMVARRHNEIGIRIALGASRRQILALVLAESGRLMIIGVAVGTALSMAAAPVMRPLLFGLSPYDAVIRTAAIALLVVVGFIASYLPARRAAAVDPTSVLRDE